MSRINIITLGVADLKRSREFYRQALGFDCPRMEDDPQIVFFDNNGSKLALYPLDRLAEDVDPDLTEGTRKDGAGRFPGITLAYNAKSREEVDRLLGGIESLGGTIAKPPRPTAWGGYGGYFRDPDGHYWEVAYGEMWRFDENDMLIMR